MVLIIPGPGRRSKYRVRNTGSWTIISTTAAPCGLELQRRYDRVRLVTRGDMDGVTSAVLITTMEEIEGIELVHPQDITDKRFEVTSNDIMANLPYHPATSMWFDHHALTDSNATPPEDFKGKHEIAPSVARVVYSYYGSDKLERFSYLVDETDRFDSANLTKEDILNPTGVILLGFTIDSRSGIGGFKEYFVNLVDWLKMKPLADVLAQPEVERRASLLRENNLAFLDLLKKHSRVDGNVIITDFRDLDTAPIGNRFLVYALFPEANVSLRLQWGPEKKFVAASLGHHIFNRTCATHCGQLASDFGGGGHMGAAACPLDAAKAEEEITEIVRRLKEAG